MNAKERVADIARRMQQGESIDTAIIRALYGVSHPTAKRDMRLVAQHLQATMVPLSHGGRLAYLPPATPKLPEGWAITRRPDLHPHALLVRSPPTGPGGLTLMPDHTSHALRLLHALCLALLESMEHASIDSLTR